jgi:hypothetical protein
MQTQTNYHTGQSLMVGERYLRDNYITNVELLEFDDETVTLDECGIEYKLDRSTFEYEFMSV